MGSPSSGPLRGLRAALLGAVCVSLAAAGHVAAGGARPSIGTLGVLAVPMMAMAAVLTAKRCRLPTVLATVAASQLALHQALMWAAQGRQCIAATPSVHFAHLGHAGQAMAGPALRCTGVSGMTGMAGTPGMAGAATGWAPTVMVLAHLIAALLSALALAHGESLIWQLGRIWAGAGRLPRPETHLPQTTGATGPTLVFAPWAPMISTGRGPAPRRGPPATVLAHT